MEYTYIHNHQSQFLEMFGNLDKTERLCDHCQVISGKSMSVKEEESSGPISYIKVADFNLAGNDKFIATSSRYVSVESASKSKMIQKGCVVFAKNGAASLSNKKRLTAIECCIDMNTMAVKINDDSLSSEYLYFFLCSIDIKDHIRQGAIPSIDPHSVESILLPLPPMDQQKTFVTIAEQADKSKFDGFKSQFIEWFGDVEYIPLKNVCLRIGEYGSNTPATDYDGSVRYLRITDINDDGSLGNEIVSPSTIEEKYYLQTNDFVFARTGNTVGKTYLHTSGKMIYAGYLIRYKLDETCVLPKFLLAYTHTSLFWDWVSKMKKVGAQPNISAQQYNELPIPGAEIASQQRFVSIAEQADKSKYYEINET